jgi:hypothetical protein
MCRSAGTARLGGVSTLSPSDVVTVRHLRKRYGDRVVVDDLERVSEAVGLFAMARARGADELLERFGLAARRTSL